MCKELESSDGSVALELVLSVAGFAVILLPAISSLAQVAASRAVADDASMAVARAWSRSDTSDRLLIARQVAQLLQARSQRGLVLDVRCTRTCTDPDSTVVVSASVVTGLRFPPVVYSVRKQQGDVFAP